MHFHNIDDTYFDYNSLATTLFQNHSFFHNNSLATTHIHINSLDAIYTSFIIIA